MAAADRALVHFLTVCPFPTFVLVVFFLVLALVVGGAMLLGVLGIGAAGFATRTHKKAERDKVAKVATVRVAEALAGQVIKVVGRAHLAGDVQSAPLTGRPCAYFEVVVEELERMQGTARWREIARERGGTAVSLQDESGTAYVELERARLERARLVVVRDETKRSDWQTEATPAALALLERHGLAEKRHAFGRQLRYREGVLEPDELAAAVGMVVWETAEVGEAGYREKPRRLVLRAAPETELIVTDDTSLF